MSTQRSEERARLLRLHRPVGGWSFRRRFVVIPYPVWQPRLCMTHQTLWPDECPVIRALRAEDPELDYAIESGYLPAPLRD